MHEPAGGLDDGASVVVQVSRGQRQLTGAQGALMLAQRLRRQEGQCARRDELGPRRLDVAADGRAYRTRELVAIKRGAEKKNEKTTSSAGVVSS